MVKAIRTHKEVGYNGMLMRDYAPHLEVPDGSAQAFAFEYGYIRGLLQAAYTEA